MEITGEFTCREAGWRPLPSGWRRSVITIQFFHRCWRCTCTETPLSSSAVKWRLNASAWLYINPPRGSVAYFLSCSRRSCVLVGCERTSVKPRGPAHHSMVGTSCPLWHVWTQWQQLRTAFKMPQFLHFFTSNHSLLRFYFYRRVSLSLQGAAVMRVMWFWYLQCVTNAGLLCLMKPLRIMM